MAKKKGGKKIEVATFAGGCFWCIESTFKILDGTLEILSGYTGGKVENPSYEQVTSGKTGHYEAVQVVFDPTIISYKGLLKVFFQQIDPTDSKGSFTDRGRQYRSAVFYHSLDQKKSAIKIIEKINQSKKFDAPVATKVLKSRTFYEAEMYHQDYSNKNPIRYRFYRERSERDIFIENNWAHSQKIFK
ncbi:MAG: peptide-methionine (S)-S-oxide reductase MsrA [Desulfobacteraceae bacterium]|nr:peptide-methionine (S)-S-oxide reductase MsrA [Desulfobacteraceae bacterium]